MESSRIKEEEETEGKIGLLSTDSSSLSYDPQQKDEKLKVPVPMRLWRERGPTSYGVKFESFKTMMELVKDGYYESQPFTAGGFNWTFLIYPTGINKNGFVSLYAKIDSSSLTDRQDVYAEVKFFVYHHASRLYYYYQENEPMMFHSFKPDRGVAEFLATSLFQSSVHGYIFDGEHCEFGIDIFVAPPFDKWEVFSYNENVSNPIFTWNLPSFSYDPKISAVDAYQSATFSSGGRDWVLNVYPHGYGEGKGNSMSLYLLSKSSNGKEYVRAKLRALNQFSYKDVEKQVEGWSSAAENKWGIEKFISLSDLEDEFKGFLVEDLQQVQVEIMAFSKRDIYPSN